MRSLITLLAFYMVGHLIGQPPSIVQAECFWDSDPGPGNGIALYAFDWAFQDPFEQAVVSSIPPSDGPHKLSVRMKGADGIWGSTFSIVVDAILMNDARLVESQMRWGAPVDSASWAIFPPADGSADDVFEVFEPMFIVPPPGLHVFSGRMKGSDGTWGPPARAIIEVVAKREPLLTEAEYFWDQDPGEGNGIAMPPADGALNSGSEELVSVDNGALLAPGPHVLNVRVRDAEGVWGVPMRSVVHMDALPTISAQLDLRVALQGCMGTGTLMNNTLRTQGLVPFEEPYTSLGYPLGNNAGTTTTPSVLNVVFPPGAAVVDWLLVELRPSYAPAQVAITMPVLLRRGGTVSDANGAYPVPVSIQGGSYHVVVRHRNHLPIRTAAPVHITQPGELISVDFTATDHVTYGENSTVLTGPLYCMWSGDANGDGELKYTGTGNDRDPLLIAVGGSTPNNTIGGYRREDINMDGIVKYIGSNNDRDPILLNIGGTTPNNVRSAQLP